MVIITAMVKARFSASRNLRFVGGQALRNPEVFAGSLGSSEVAAKEEPVFGNDHPALQLSGFEVGLKDLSASIGCRIWCQKVSEISGNLQQAKTPLLTPGQKKTQSVTGFLSVLESGEGVL